MINRADYVKLKDAIEFNKMEDVIVDELFIKRNNVLYNGFWGKNGYYDLQVVFKLDDKYYKSPKGCTDIVSIEGNKLYLDAPSNCNYIRLYSLNGYKFKIRLGMSEIAISMIKKNKEEK